MDNLILLTDKISELKSDMEEIKELKFKLLNEIKDNFLKSLIECDTCNKKIKIISLSTNEYRFGLNADSCSICKEDFKYKLKLNNQFKILTDGYDKIYLSLKKKFEYYNNDNMLMPININVLVLAGKHKNKIGKIINRKLKYNRDPVYSFSVSLELKLSDGQIIKTTNKNTSIMFDEDYNSRFTYRNGYIERLI